MTSIPTISIIIPVLHDAPALDRCLSQFTPVAENIEIIIVDGGSQDDTLQRIALLQTSVKLITSPPGRGRQLHRGAQSANGQILLFLHADTTLPSGWMDDVYRTLNHAPQGIGYFDLALDVNGIFFQGIEIGVKLRSRWLKLPYGDQAYFMDVATYTRLGGFKPLPLMEDVDFIERAAQETQIVSTATRVVTSARNWTMDGKWKRVLTNLKTLYQYKRGKDIHELRSEYQGVKPALSIFCKKPEPGKVKTRLAVTIGRTQAAELYRQMVEDTLREMARLDSIRRYVTFTPPEGYAYFYKWLGPNHRYLPQTAGDLGHRMLTAAHTLNHMGHTHVLFIGTDCPGLSRNHIQQALQALNEHDIILIPSFDGGYVLIGMKDVYPSLFENIDWSTEHVLEQTQAKAEQEGLSLTLLDPLKDIDTAEDL